MVWLIIALLILQAYLLGSIPTGYLVAKYVKGIDIREEGSGSTGATNVLRTIGKTAAIFVLIGDMAKAMLAVGIIKLWFIFTPLAIIPLEWKSWLIVAGSMAAILGHSKSIFLNFTGGKSVASSLGLLLVLNPIVALGALATFLGVLGLFRMVSLSSIMGVIAVNILMLVLHQPLSYCLFAVVGGIYVIARHRTNIMRIFEGTEPRIGEKLTSEAVKTV
ncbi:glycerol-3-phosphate 1-O-acyltransferase PlsY [Aphanothece sacrum]|uniref:Glycerol-3-phosphate acyltransferase n=1 Tax=Aphanothece sacrum FPU1 TaxID=1920663 RepID=A0A401IE22_APHSA|nr:glycerol-3-phosphate 1-O-acyltransferase PlsY [Aphanothece sacrum]GBF79532.1 glycerol-3-phosphate acyltransferase [Aphanothece sacrum FPU1]GBF83927.1 glycerol-3-phosphate acyltransferase [Aphanothece sacrum FPU3]